jgi:hypothetical protein
MNDEFVDKIKRNALASINILSHPYYQAEIDRIANSGFSIDLVLNRVCRRIINGEVEDIKSKGE